MFDFSFGELMVVALVALIVLGPERLPKAARFTGLWVRRARAQWYSVKSELEQELASDELKRSLHAGRDAMREAETHLRDFASDIERPAPAPDAAADTAPRTDEPAAPTEPRRDD
ncbi:Sec-independent protein translocase protein TatB [Thermomonas sp.]|jgi:sec-independent protein translocase protein TatB|uniref:Sec-independent protein translocase protein TatB n=1 Tax=Thermomonas sp. TaxID=1971895 RepID=UPI0035AF0948